MTEQKKYPGTQTDPNNRWTNESNIEAEDEACASCSLRGNKDLNEMIVSGFGFDIPANAVISAAYIGILGCACNAYGAYYPFPDFAMEYIENSTVHITGDTVSSPCACGDAVSPKEVNIITLLEAHGLNTPSFFNNEEWHKTCVFGGSDLAIGNSFLVDACWIRVVYTVPVAKRVVGDGLTCVVS